jgi:MFS family permease
LAASVVQALTYKNNLILAMVVSTLLISFTRATGTLSVSYLPLKTKNYINAATLSMILNAAACIGAAFGPTVAGTVIDNNGWSAYNILMCAFYVVSFITILLCTSKIKKLNI